jgi:hypothetical protein
MRNRRVYPVWVRFELLVIGPKQLKGPLTIKPPLTQHQSHRSSFSENVKVLSPIKTADAGFAPQHSGGLRTGHRLPSGLDTDNILLYLI